MPPQDLAGRIARQRVEEVDGLRRLEAGDALRVKLMMSVALAVLPGFITTIGLHGLAPFRVRHADHRDIGDVGMLHSALSTSAG